MEKSLYSEYIKLYNLKLEIFVMLIHIANESITQKSFEISTSNNKLSGSYIMQMRFSWNANPYSLTTLKCTMNKSP